jgi:fimbrial chaperone protein
MLALSGQAIAANFDIKPIKIYFDAQTRIEKLTVKNLSDENFNLQIKAYKWTQNEKGEDLYEDTNDIILFPKIVSLKQGEERIVRVGTNLSAGTIERTYRIYLEQMPPAEDEARGANVRMLMRIGVPVFISPVTKDEKGDVESVSLKNGKAEIKVKNSGNLHFIVSSININGMDSEGKSIYATELGGWYILNNRSKVYETSIPEEKCNGIAKLDVAVKTNSQVACSKVINVGKATCGPGR